MIWFMVRNSNVIVSVNLKDIWNVVLCIILVIRIEEVGILKSLMVNSTEQRDDKGLNSIDHFLRKRNAKTKVNMTGVPVELVDFTFRVANENGLFVLQRVRE